MGLKKRMTSALWIAIFSIGIIWSAVSCKTVDIFERNVPIPGHQWDHAFTPVISFNITDTVSLYNIYVTIRHTYAYNFNNIWLNLSFQLPGDSLKEQKVDILLADNNKGWLGTGMDDLFEVRSLITPQPFRFKNSGESTFTIEQIMRENPLKHVMNAGIRVEKVER